MQSFIKNTIFILIFIAIGVIGYYLIVSERDASIDNASPDYIQAELESQIFLQRLNELKVIKLSGEIFQSSMFSSLKSFSTPPPFVSSGRDNPFKPAE